MCKFSFLLLTSFMLFLFLPQAEGRTRKRADRAKMALAMGNPHREFIRFCDTLQYHKNSYEFTGYVFLPNENKYDTTKVEVFFYVKDVRMDSLRIIGYYSPESRPVLSLKRGKADETLEARIECIPPVTPRGKSLFISVKAHYERWNVDKCYIRGKLKAKRTDGPFKEDTRWPGKEEWRNGKWLQPLEGPAIEWGSPRKKQVTTVSP